MDTTPPQSETTSPAPRKEPRVPSYLENVTRARGQKRRAVERSLAAELSDLADECRAAGGDCSAIRACVGEQCRSLTALTPKDE